jgi:alpha-1,2-mannosyltransferase
VRLFFRLWFFLTMPLFVATVSVIVLCARGPHASDFWTFWQASRDVLHGHSASPDLATLPALASRTFAPYVYPPVLAFLLAPVGVLPFFAAKLVFALLSVGALAGALRLLRVRDWRCYGVAFATAPAFAATAIGTISLFLLFGVALAWRYRDRAVACGLAVAFLVTAKLFLWPLWFWLVRTKRYRAAAVAAGSSFAAVVVSWAAIGFGGLTDYPALLGRLTELVGPNSYSTYALQRAFDVSPSSAQSVTYVLGIAALATAFRFVRDDRRVLLAMLGVAFLATPILWPHYLVLLLVPVALTSTTYTRFWLAPVALWADSTAWSDGHPVRIVVALAATIAIVAVALLRELDVQSVRDAVVGRHDQLPATSP